MIARLKQLVSGQNSLMGAAAILVATTLLSNVLGLLRDRFFAQKIPTDLLDTYFAAFRIPDFVLNILILGTVTAAFIPVFLEYREKDKEEAWEVAHIVITLAVVLLIILSVILFVTMPLLVPLVVPDFSAEKQGITVDLARILLVQPFFFGLSYLFSGILNALKRFFVYALAPLIYTVSIIVATLVFSDQYGVYALAWGVVIGAFLHMFIQFLTARTIGFRLVPNFTFTHSAIRRVGVLMLPRSVGLGALQLTLLAFTAIASALGPGSVAIYNLADNIQTMPTAVFGLSFITALYPTLSEAVAQRRLTDFAQLLERALRYLLVILIPAGIGLILLRAQIVRLILGTGHFGWEETIATADTLGLFALSLFAQAIVVLLSRAFYALHDTKTPTLLNLVGYGLAIGLGIWFAPATGLGLGVPGLALAFSVGSFANLLLLYIAIRRRVVALASVEQGFGQFVGQLMVGSGILFVVVQVAKMTVAQVVNMDRFWGIFVQTGVAITVGVLVYWGVMRALKVPEVALVERMVRSRFWPLGRRVNPVIPNRDLGKL